MASAALSVAIGMMVAIALMIGSFRETVVIWVDQTLTSDLWLRPAKGLTNSAALFPPSILPRLRQFPFIEGVDPAHGTELVYQDDLITMATGDFHVAARFSHLPFIEPRSAAIAIEDAIKEKGVVVSESFAGKYRKHVGEKVRLPTFQGFREFPVTGIYRDYSNDRGVIVMDRDLFVASFGDASINSIAIYLKTGVDPHRARQTLERELGASFHAFAVDNASIRREVMRIFDQTFLITYALLAVAIVVAVLGVINTMAALILERTREIALLRVSGMTAAEIRRMILLESGLLALTSTLVGLLMGFLLSLILIYVINKQSFGWTIEFHTPVALIAGSLAVTFVASMLAGLPPARLANSIQLASAIKSE